VRADNSRSLCVPSRMSAFSIVGNTGSCQTVEESQSRETTLSLDWRLQGQERYLKHERLCWRKYTPFRADWDHDHCEFCGRKLSTQPSDINEGYSTENAHHWICKDCFADFREQFEWTVVECSS